MRKFALVVSTTILILLITAAMLIALPKLFGIQLFTVLGSSMEKALSVGDLIYVFPTDSEKIQEGDVITFVLNQKLTVVTHRVVEVDRENRRFRTKGDANELKDAGYVIYGNVVGVQKLAIPKAGYLFNYVNTTPGRVISITTIVLLTLISFLLSGIKPKSAKPDQREHQ